MITLAKKTLTALVAISLLSGLSACSGIPSSSPNMIDYSYVPPTQAITVLTVPGIEAD